jgi:hypothetical protein
MRNFIGLLVATALFLSLMANAVTAQQLRSRTRSPNRPRATRRWPGTGKSRTGRDDPDLPPNLQISTRGPTCVPAKSRSVSYAACRTRS